MRRSALVLLIAAAAVGGTLWYFNKPQERKHTIPTHVLEERVQLTEPLREYIDALYELKHLGKEPDNLEEVKNNLELVLAEGGYDKSIAGLLAEGKAPEQLVQHFARECLAFTTFPGDISDISFELKHLQREETKTVIVDDKEVQYTIRYFDKSFIQPFSTYKNKKVSKARSGIVSIIRKRDDGYETEINVSETRGSLQTYWQKISEGKEELDRQLADPASLDRLYWQNRLQYLGRLGTLFHYRDVKEAYERSNSQEEFVESQLPRFIERELIAAETKITDGALEMDADKNFLIISMYHTLLKGIEAGHGYDILGDCMKFLSEPYGTQKVHFNNLRFDLQKDVPINSAHQMIVNSFHFYLGHNHKDYPELDFKKFLTVGTFLGEMTKLSEEQMCGIAAACNENYFKGKTVKEVVD